MSLKLLKSTAVVSLMTLVSRVSGLVRDVIMANVLGSGSISDAFFVAFRIPNFLRRIFGEGAFSQAFIPVYTELNEQNTQEAKQFIASTSGRLGMIVFILSILGVVFAPYIIQLFAPGFVNEPEKFKMTVDSLRIMFPYLFFITIVAMSAAMLNTLNRFAVPAATPVLLNICLIVTLLVFVQNLSQFDSIGLSADKPMINMQANSAAKTLAFGVLVAGCIQLLFQLPALKKQGVLVKPNLKQHPATTKVFKLMVPAMFGVSVAQINTLVNTILASFLVTGSVSWLYYSDRLMEFPVGVFGIALATVVLPSLSKERQHGSSASYSSMIDWALRWVVMIAMPAAVALALLAVPLLASMFQYNAFKDADVLQASLSLMAYSVGVVAFITIKVLASGFYAQQNTKTPVKIAAFSVICNIALSLLLIGPLKHAGLALAISLAAWINACLLAFQLWRKSIYVPESGWLLFLLRIFIAIIVMSTVLFIFRGDQQMWLDASLFSRFWKLLSLIMMGAVSYFAILYCVGLRPHQLLLRQQVKPENQ